MKNYQIRTCPQSQYEQVKPFIREEYWYCLQEEQDVDVLAAWAIDDEQETICGALLAVLEDERYQVLSLFVEEEHRNKGIAGLLLSEAENLAIRHNMEKIHVIYRVTAENADSVHRLLFSAGYQFPKTKSRIYRITLENLKQSYLAKLPFNPETMSNNIVEFDSLPTDVYREYRMRLGKDIPYFLGIENAIGVIIPEFCLAYHQDRKVTAFVVMTEEENGLYLNSAYIKTKQSAPFLVRMLQKVWYQVKDGSKYPHLTINAINAESENLLEKLFTGAEFTVETVYETQKTITKMLDFPLPDGFGGVLARTNTITEILADEGYTVEITITPGALPTMRLFVPGVEEPIDMAYESVDGENYSAFILTLQKSDGTEARLEETPEFYEEVPLNFIKEFLKN